GRSRGAAGLRVAVALPEGAFGRFAAGGARLHQAIVERGAISDLLFESFGARAQRLVGELCELAFERVDLIHARLIALDAPLVCRAKEFAGNRADHAEDPF